MTVEEIKSTYTMRDILQMYGMQPNRAGFINCPFHHGDRTASCKIYPKDFHCHACGANGDIFTFVEKMENCSFKYAFKRLGGSYGDKTDRQRDLFNYKLQKAKESRLRRIERLQKRKAWLNEDIEKQREIKDHAEVFSDAWCEAVNQFEKDFIEWEEIFIELRGLKHDS